MSNEHKAVIYSCDAMLDQVSDLMEKNNTIEGRAAIADCLTIIIRNRRQAIESDFTKALDDSFSGGVT